MCCSLFAGFLSNDTPPCILLNIMGWHLDPVFATDWSILRSAMRYKLFEPSWVESVSLSFSLRPWCKRIPQFLPLLQRFGWRLSPASHGGTARTDENQCVRTFVIGVDRPCVLWEWLVEHHQQLALKQCERVVRSLHRRGPDSERLAGGLVLPGPPGGGICRFDGHKKAFAAAGTKKNLRYAAAASGLSIWFEKAGTRLLPDDPEAMCWCGQLMPSRPHLMWACEATLQYRQDIALPVHRAEERLFARVTPCQPAPPPMGGDDPFPALCQACGMCAMFSR